MKPQISIIMPDEPSRFGKGYQVLAFHRINSLRLNYELEVISICPSIKLFNKVEQKELNGIRVLKCTVGILSIIWNLVLSLITFKPLLYALYRNSHVIEYLTKAKSNYYIFYLSRTYFDLSKKNGFTIIEFVDSMYKNFQSRCFTARGIKFLIYLYEAHSSKHFETRISRKVDLATAVSADDAQIISENVITAPIGVERVNFKKKRKYSPHITFSGKMNYAPNTEAVIWFYKNVWTNLSKDLKEYKFKILGAYPPPELLELVEGDSSVIVTGFVDSLIDELSESKISVAPMLSGSGMQFKILEAMACNIPVITTSRGLGDIKAKNGSEVLIAETAKDFENCIQSLINNIKFSDRVKSKASKFIKNNHLWGNLNIQFENRILSLQK